MGILFFVIYFAVSISPGKKSNTRILRISYLVGLLPQAFLGKSSIYLVVLLEMPAIINVLTFSQNDERSLNSQYIIQMIMDARRGLL